MIGIVIWITMNLEISIHISLVRYDETMTSIELGPEGFQSTYRSNGMTLFHLSKEHLSMNFNPHTPRAV